MTELKSPAFEPLTQVSTGRSEDPQGLPLPQVEDDGFKVGDRVIFSGPDHKTNFGVVVEIAMDRRPVPGIFVRWNEYTVSTFYPATHFHQLSYDPDGSDIGAKVHHAWARGITGIITGVDRDGFHIKSEGGLVFKPYLTWLEADRLMRFDRVEEP